jgi:hypothetical protein
LPATPAAPFPLVSHCDQICAYPVHANVLRANRPHKKRRQVVQYACERRASAPFACPRSHSSSARTASTIPYNDLRKAARSDFSCSVNPMWKREL